MACPHIRKGHWMVRCKQYSHWCEYWDRQHGSWRCGRVKKEKKEIDISMWPNWMLQWALKDIEIQADSFIFRSWIHSVITNEKRVCLKGAAELIILCYFGILNEMVDKFELRLSVVFVSSDMNKADSLNRVRKRWLKVEEETAEVCCVAQEEMKELYNLHHMGVDRTL